MGFWLFVPCSGTGEAPLLLSVCQIGNSIPGTLEATATARASNRDSCALRLAERAAPFAEEPECGIECRGCVLETGRAGCSTGAYVVGPGVLDGSARLAEIFASLFAVRPRFSVTRRT